MPRYKAGLQMAWQCHRWRIGSVTHDFAIVTANSGGTDEIGHVSPEWPVTINRNRRSRSSGIAGHDAPEYPTGTSWPALIAPIAALLAPLLSVATLYGSPFAFMALPKKRLAVSRRLIAFPCLSTAR